MQIIKGRDTYDRMASLEPSPALNALLAESHQRVMSYQNAPQAWLDAASLAYQGAVKFANMFNQVHQVAADDSMLFLDPNMVVYITDSRQIAALSPRMQYYAMAHKELAEGVSAGRFYGYDGFQQSTVFGFDNQPYTEMFERTFDSEDPEQPFVIVVNTGFTEDSPPLAMRDRSALIDMHRTISQSISAGIDPTSPYDITEI